MGGQAEDGSPESISNHSHHLGEAETPGAAPSWGSESAKGTNLQVALVVAGAERPLLIGELGSLVIFQS